MMEDFWIVEVFYNESGLKYNPDSPVRQSNRYHSLFKPVIGKTKEEVENKINAWFVFEKPEYKIFEMQIHRTLL